MSNEITRLVAEWRREHRDNYAAESAASVIAAKIPDNKWKQEMYGELVKELERMRGRRTE